MSGPAEKESDDPSMEDILASIRRILNDDEAPAADEGGEAALVAHEAPASHHADHAPATAPPDDIFVLDQTMMIEEPAPMPPRDPFDDEPPIPEPPPTRPASRSAETQHDAEPEGESLLNPSAAAAATASMGALVRVLNQQQMPVYRGGPTLEDMVRDEIRPLVKSWLDENLPPMVERMVRAEIARVTGAK